MPLVTTPSWLLNFIWLRISFDTPFTFIKSRKARPAGECFQKFLTQLISSDLTPFQTYVHKSIITTRTVTGETTSIKISLSAPHIYQRVLQLQSNPTLQPLITKILRWWLKFRRQTACALPELKHFQIAGHKTYRQTSEIRTNAISKLLFCIMLYHGSLFEFVDRV